MKKVVVVLKLARLSVPHKIEKARFIVTSMTGNAAFATPNPTLASITTNINALETAYLAAKGGSVDETANMYTKEFVLELSLKSLAAYVESIANANTVTAETVVLSSGMEIKTPVIRTARDFSVKPSETPGEVKLSTRHERNSTYIWQMSLDPSQEANWLTIGQATQASLVKNGLISGARYYFRVASVGKEGQGVWSNVLNTIVL